VGQYIENIVDISPTSIYLYRYWVILLFIAPQHTDAQFWYSKSVCSSVRSSVRPLRSGTRWKRLNISS